MHPPPEVVGFWPRLAAAAIDYVAIAVVCAGLGAAAGGLSGLRPAAALVWSDAIGGDPVLGALAGVVTGFALVGALGMSLEAWSDATLGKRILRLVVVGADGLPAPAAVRASRYLVKNCHLLLGAASSLSGMWIAGALAPLATLVVVAGSAMVYSGDHRALHDIVAGTAVVRRPPPVRP